jgi:hypothetical protein
VQVGTTCTVREIDPPDPPPGFVFDTPTISPGNPITVGEAGELVEVVVDNPLREIFGRIEVRKLVTGAPGGYPPDAAFAFRLDCDNDAFDAAFTLVAGQAFVSEPIRVGTTCTVTEVSRPSAASGFVDLPVSYRPSPPTVTVQTEGEVVAVQVTNATAPRPTPSPSPPPSPPTTPTPTPPTTPTVSPTSTPAPSASTTTPSPSAAVGPGDAGGGPAVAGTRTGLPGTGGGGGAALWLGALLVTGGSALLVAVRHRSRRVR